MDAVHEGLMNEDYNYIEDLKDFKMDTELSTIDNVVLHNAVTGVKHIICLDLLPKLFKSPHVMSYN